MNCVIKRLAVTGMLLIGMLLTGCNSELAFHGDTNTDDELVRIEIGSDKVSDGSIPLFVNENATLVATGYYQSGLSKEISPTVEWVTSNREIASINEAGLVTGVAPGNASVTATMGGVSSNPVSVTVASAKVVGIEVSPSPVLLEVGKSLALVATASLDDGSAADVSALATWHIADDNIAAVSGQGELVGLIEGKTSITAQWQDVTSDATSVTVTSDSGGVSENPLVSIQIAPTTPITAGVSKLTIAKGNTQPFTATGFYKDGSAKPITTDVEWLLSNTQIARMAPNGELTALKAGEVVLSSNHSGVSSNSITITVTNAVITSIQVTPSPISLHKGQTQPLEAIASYSDDTTARVTSSVQWQVEDLTIATVSAEGVLTAHHTGTSAVTATLDEVSSNVAILTVTDPVIRAIQVTPATVSLAKGQEQALTAVAYYSDDTTADMSNSVTWTLEDPLIASSSSSGIVRALKVGSTKATARLEGITSNEVHIEVTNAVPIAIEVSPAQLSVAKGNATSLVATVRYSDGTTTNLTESVTWSSGDTLIATVASDGRLIGMGVGQTTVSARYSHLVSNIITVTVTDAVITSLLVAPDQVRLIPQERLQLAATATYSDGARSPITDTVAWFSNDTGVATITRNGMLSGVAPGTATIVAAMDGVESNPVTVDVTSASLTAITISPSPVSLAKGNHIDLTATGLHSDNSHLDITSQVTWETANKAIATVTAQGQLVAVTEGSTTVKASKNGITSDLVTVDVTAAEVTALQVTPSPVSVPLGPLVNQPLTATATYSDGTMADVTASVTWHSGNISVARINTSGQLTGNSLGATTVSASMGGVQSDDVDVTVTEAVLMGYSINPSSISMPKGLNENLRISGIFSNMERPQNLASSMDWQSADPSIVSVDSEGQLTGIDVGSTTITATYQGESLQSGGVVATATVTEPVPVECQPSPSSLTLAIGESQSLIYHGVYSDAQTVRLDMRSISVSPLGHVEINIETGAIVVTGAQVGYATLGNVWSGGGVSNYFSIPCSDVSVEVTSN